MIDFTKTAIVFPGQGSQSVGMLQDIAESFDEIHHTFEEASDELGYDLWQLVLNGPKEQLDETSHTQPALLTASYALWKIIRKHSGPPQMLAGHSLGEYTALVCAESISFKQAVKLVAARGTFMQEAVPVGEGAMAAIIGLDDHAVLALCKEAKLTNEILSPANFNSIGQVVIAGHRASVENAINLAKENGAKIATLIPVSVPSHCELMRPAAEKLSALLSDISIESPQMTVISNVEAKAYTTAESVREGLIRQLYAPVRWVETIQFFAAAGVQTVIECGPDKVLTGLNKRIHKPFQLLNTNNKNQLEQLIQLEA